MYVTYTRIYGWSDYGGESSYQPGYRLENMMWMTLLVYDYIIPGENIMRKMQVMVIKYGYAILEVDSEEEALGRTKNMKDCDFDWSDFDDAQVVDNDVYY